MLSRHVFVMESVLARLASVAKKALSSKSSLFLVLLLAPAAAFSKEPLSAIIVTSVIGSWQSAKGADLKHTDQLQPGEEIRCRAGSGLLRVAANGVPMEYACTAKPAKVTLPAKPTLPEQWIASLNNLATKRKPVFFTSVGRGVDDVIEAVLLPHDGGGVNFSPSIAGFVRSMPPGGETVSLQIEKTEEVGFADVELPRSSLSTKHSLPAGLYYVSVTAPQRSSKALVYLPPDAKAQEFDRRFSIIRDLTRVWPNEEDAKAFRLYCLFALAEEAR